MKTVFFEAGPKDAASIRKKLKNASIEEKEIQNANLGKYKDSEIISVFVNSRLSAKTLSKLPKLKLIATRSTGYDHIDMNYCQKKGIKVANVPNYGKHTVAEHAFALLLALSRKIEQSVKATRSGRFDTIGLEGFDLNSKTIGIIGTGNIGTHAIRIAKGFEMNVIAYDALPNEKLSKEIGFKNVDLKYLLKNSDIISVHLPLQKKTFHLLNQKNLKFVKKGCVIINTSRGAIIETDALIEGLKSKRIGFAGLDVLEEELILKDELGILKTKMTLKQLRTAIEEHALLQMENVIITPHNAFNTKEALGRILEQTIQNIMSYQRGKIINEVKWQQLKK